MPKCKSGQGLGWIQSGGVAAQIQWDNILGSKATKHHELVSFGLLAFFGMASFDSFICMPNSGLFVCWWCNMFLSIGFG